MSTSVEFLDANGDGFLEGGETGEFRISITNSGRGNAWSMGLIFDLADQALISDLEPFTGNHLIDQIAPGASKLISIPITARKSIATTQLGFVGSITEANGFDPEPFRVFLQALAFKPPQLELADLGVIDEAGRNVIQPGEVVTVTARIFNAGQGVAENVRAKLRAGDNVFLGGIANGQLTRDLGDLQPGEYQDLVFDAFCNSRAEDFPLYLSLEEAEGQYGLTELSLGLDLHRPQRSPTDFVIPTRQQEQYVIGEAPELTDSVERDIPRAREINDNAVAVIIGNRNYRGNTPQVSYASRDAALVKEYVQKSLGYPAGNILSLDDATLTEFRLVFGDDRNPSGRLSDLIRRGQSDVFVYFSGHGAPDPSSRSGYLMPVDSDPNHLSLTGYKLETLYRNLSSLGARNVTVVIDACFSGASGAGDMLIASASPIGIEVTDPAALIGNGTVITASSGSEIASWYPQTRYGLLTYMFLKGLQGDADVNSDGKISVGEIRAYIQDQNNGVPYLARLLHGRQQTPQVWGDEGTLIRR